MKSVDQIIQEKEIWAGLNHPGISLEQADILVCGIPFDGGISFRAGAKDAPRALREITYTIDPATERFESMEGLKILDLGDAEGENREQIFKKVEQVAYACTKNGKLMTFIGGDHSTTIPVLWGIDKALEEPLGIIHIDAHFDLCDEMGGDRLSHGSTERRALELKNIPDTESIYFLGVRSAESEEVKFLQKNKINLLSAREIRHAGVSQALEKVKKKMAGFAKIYLTIDIDALDPAYAPGTGTPQFGGLDSREMLDLLYGLFELPVIGFDLVEVAPCLEESQITLFAARKIIMECWGHHWRKGANIYGKYEAGGKT